LCKARGFTSDSRSLESISSTINLAYIKKNCWNLDDPTITFREPRKTRSKISEVPTTSVAPDTSAPSLLDPSTAPSTIVPSSSTPASPAPIPAQFPIQLSASSASASDFVFTLEMLHSMMQSLHRGQVIIMQSLQSLGLPFIMGTDEFLTQVAWPGVQPSPFGGGGTSIAQELEAAEEQVPAEQDEPTPHEPFEFVIDTMVA